MVDEMVLTGETMRMVSISVQRKARSCQDGVPFGVTEGWKPTWYGMETAGHIMFPWDYEVISRGEFVINPAYREYLDSLEMIDAWRR